LVYEIKNGQGNQSCPSKATLALAVEPVVGDFRQNLAIFSKFYTAGKKGYSQPH
jgi:hypothetical protein